MLSQVTDMKSDDVITLAVKAHIILWSNVLQQLNRCEYDDNN